MDDSIAKREPMDIPPEDLPEQELPGTWTHSDFLGEGAPDPHGMRGSSETHCCYKHESKDYYREWQTFNLKEELKECQLQAQNNSFRAIDRCEAINELLFERQQNNF